MKLHLGAGGEVMIVAQDRTASNVDDATTGRKIIERVKGELDSVSADAAYGTRPFYNLGSKRGANIVVPPMRTVTVGGQRCPAREESLARVNEIGRQQWKKESGYHRQG